MNKWTSGLKDRFKNCLSVCVSMRDRSEGHKAGCRNLEAGTRPSPCRLWFLSMLPQQQQVIQSPALPGPASSAPLGTRRCHHLGGPSPSSLGSSSKHQCSANSSLIPLFPGSSELWLLLAITVTGLPQCSLCSYSL